MKLKFIGKKIKSCSSCRGKLAFERKNVYNLVTPFGIKVFRVGVVYEMDTKEFDFFRKMTYSIGGVVLHYFDLP